jgi:hypothetical protein
MRSFLNVCVRMLLHGDANKVITLPTTDDCAMLKRVQWIKNIINYRKKRLVINYTHHVTRLYGRIKRNWIFLKKGVMQIWLMGCNVTFPPASPPQLLCIPCQNSVLWWTHHPELCWNLELAQSAHVSPAGKPETYDRPTHLVTWSLLKYVIWLIVPIRQTKHVTFQTENDPVKCVNSSHLFTCSLLIYASSVTKDYIVLNKMVVSQWWNGNDLEGSTCGLATTWRDWGKP